MTIRLGHINYLNCIPVQGAIVSKKIPFQGEIIYGNPAELNRLLEIGKLDISPSSSVELLKGYKILPTFSISSRITVKSIILFTKKPLEKIKKGLFFITSHSATSALLLKILLSEFYKIDAIFSVFNPDTSSLKDILSHSEGALYIGDTALKMKNSSEFYNYDLAEIWHRYTQLPFTFALWQLRKGFNDRDKIKYLYDLLTASYGYYKAKKRQLAESFSSKFNMSVDDIVDYWDTLSFELKEEQLKSLKLYFRLAKRHHFIEKEPIIEIISL